MREDFPRSWAPQTRAQRFRCARCIATQTLASIALLFTQQIVTVQAQMAGGGSIREFRRPANPPVHREAGGGRLKDQTKKRAIDSPQVTAGSQTKANTETASGGSTRPKDAPRTATKTESASRSILDVKSGGGRGIAPAPTSPSSDRTETVAAAPASTPIPAFDNVEDAIEAGNNARDQKPPDYRAAELAYRAATTLAPDDERGFIGLGNIYYDQRDFEQAISAYRKAVELKPKNFSVWENLGSAHYELGQYQEAIKASYESIRLDSGPTGPYFIVTWASLTIGDGETAGNMAKAFTYRWQPPYIGDPPYYVTFAGYLGYREAGRTEEANKLLAVPPDSNECADKNWVCRLLKYLRHEVSAAQLLKEANDNGKMTEAQTYIGVDLALSGKRAEALPYLRWVVANGDRTFTEYGLAKAWVKKLEGP